MHACIVHTSVTMKLYRRSLIEARALAIRNDLEANSPNVHGYRIAKSPREISDNYRASDNIAITVAAQFSCRFCRPEN